jgi:hypothetical protein
MAPALRPVECPIVRGMPAPCSPYIEGAHQGLLISMTASPWASLAADPVSAAPSQHARPKARLRRSSAPAAEGRRSPAGPSTSR